MDIENYQESNFKKNIKALFNRVKISNFLSLIVIFCMIILFSLWNIGWNPEKIGWEVFIVNLSFFIFLGVYGLFFGESTGRSYYKTIITGVYQVAREAFLSIKEKIVEKGYTDLLPDYITWRYQLDYNAECKRKLLSVRLFNNHILELTKDEIEKMHNEPIEKCWTEDSIEYFSKLSDKQYDVIKAILDGEISVDYIDDYNFYLMDTKSEEISLVTKIKSSEKTKMKITWQQRLSKVALIVLFALIGAGIAIDNINGQSNGQTLLNLIQRLSVLTTSIICGFNTARILNQEDVEVIKYKTSYLSVFFSSITSGNYKPLDYEQKAKKEYEENHKKTITEVDYEKQGNNTIKG